MFKGAATYSNHTDLQEYTGSVTAYIKHCLDDVTVTKAITIRANQKPWMTAEVRGLLKQGSRVRPIWSHVWPNFSPVRPAVREKKSLCDSESLPVVQQQTHIRPISWSKPIRDSEGRTPPPWLAVVQIFLYVCVSLKMRVLLQSERWVEMHAVLPI